MRPPFIPPSVRPQQERLPEPVLEVAEVPVVSAVPADDPIPIDWANTGELESAFDWQTAARLVRDPNNASLADEEWSSTDWDDLSSEGNQAASILSQLARRVKSGELKVDISSAASPEAVLASLLSTLLSSAGGIKPAREASVAMSQGALRRS